MSRFTFNFYLDIRKPLKSNRFAITVNLYDVIAKKTSNFTIKKVNGLEISAQDKKEFESIWTDRHKKDSFGNIIGEKTVYGKKLELRTVLKVKEDLLNQIIENPDVHNYKDVKEAFKNYSISKNVFNGNVYAGFDSKIKELAASGRYGSASQYKSTKNMIYKYMSGLELTFYHIDVNWLDSYYRARSKSASVSTVSLDLRNLKAIYNIAKEQDDRLIIKYPFGKGKYQIPEGSASRNIGLSDVSLKKIQDFKSDNYYLQTARDYFMFSYYSNGLNLKDILLLEKGQETFTRAKSRNTAKKEVKMYAEHNEHQLDIISRHKGCGKYLFNVLNDDDDDLEIYTKTKATLRRVAKQFKEPC